MGGFYGGALQGWALAARSSHYPSAPLQSTNTSWKGAFTPVWCSIFTCGSLFYSHHQFYVGALILCRSPDFTSGALVLRLKPLFYVESRFYVRSPVLRLELEFFNFTSRAQVSHLEPSFYIWKASFCDFHLGHTQVTWHWWPTGLMRLVP